MTDKGKAAEFVARRRRYRALMASEGLDGLLVTHLPDLRYLCGFSGSSGLALLLREGGFFYTDFRYREQAKREVAGLRKVAYAATAGEAVARTLARREGMRLGFDPAALSYAAVLDMRRCLRGRAALVPLKASLMQLRAVKSRPELAAMRVGIGMAERAFKQALGALPARVSERELAAHLDGAARALGAEALAFETIVASGSRGALVHARPGAGKLAGATVIDWGVVNEGYCTDATRTIAFTRVPAEIRKAHAIVLDAQERALETIRPGVRAREVDHAAREVVERAGYGDAFGHGLGHGVGLEVHERPHVGASSRDVLEEGMVFTCEPGIYLPGVGGVRVEDMVLVTESGVEVLTTLPRSLDPSDY